MLLFLIVLVAACGFMFIAFRSDMDGSLILALIFSVIAVLMIICMVVENGCAQANLASYQQEHDVLQYQVDNHFYDNIVDNSKKELYNEVMSYNKNVANGRALNKNIWVGVFYSDIYNELEFVELP